MNWKCVLVIGCVLNAWPNHGFGQSVLVDASRLRSELAASDNPAGFVLSGDAAFGRLLDDRKENAGRGVRLISGRDENGDGQRNGAVSVTVQEVSADKGRWFQLRIRALTQDGFRVEKDQLFLKVEFSKDAGTNSLDQVTKLIYAQVERDRSDLKDAGTNQKLGPATWRNYSLEFRTPFPEVDTLRLTAGFEFGVGEGDQSDFRIHEIELTRIAPPEDYLPAERSANGTAATPAVMQSLVKLGGRWYFDPRGGMPEVPESFDHTNADQVLYLSDRLEPVFAGNMTAWLRKGFLDRSGKSVEADHFLPDNVTIRFTKTHLVMRSKNIPNHPTAVFPDRSRSLDGNPNVIQERNNTWYLPLEPSENSQHIAMDATNSNRALPMGPIGVAVNGVVFFNPFDHIENGDAVWRLDRCCGHPGPRGDYHYHKYPACVKSPWTDDGEEHSPVIGFAFDGFPVYGPYESKGELAKDSRSNPLNEFNGHHDDVRGWHYHVTPGRYPHLIGGYWGTRDPLNRNAGGGPPRGPRRP